MMKTIEIGPKGGILHVNRLFIAQNAKDNGQRPVYTLKPNGKNSKPIYARTVCWNGPTTAVSDDEQLSCGARAWIALSPGVTVSMIGAATYVEAKEPNHEG